MRGLLKLDYPDAMVRQVLGIPKRMWRKIPRTQRRWIAIDRLAFILDTQPVFRDNKMPVIRAGWRRLYGFENMLADVTWEEFMYADTLMMRKKHRESISVLYRPRMGLSHNPVVRIPFSMFGLDRNTERLAKVDEETLFALVTNYQAVRSAALERKYGYLFPSADESTMDGKKIELDEEDDRKNTPSWPDIHHTLMGDKAYLEPQFLHSKATTMLNWLNRRIKENRETERKLKK